MYSFEVFTASVVLIVFLLFLIFINLKFIGVKILL